MIYLSASTFASFQGYSPITVFDTSWSSRVSPVVTGNWIVFRSLTPFSFSLYSRHSHHDVLLVGTPLLQPIQCRALQPCYLPAVQMGTLSRRPPPCLPRAGHSFVTSRCGSPEMSLSVSLLTCHGGKGSQKVAKMLLTWLLVVSDMTFRSMGFPHIFGSSSDSVFVPFSQHLD